MLDKIDIDQLPSNADITYMVIDCLSELINSLIVGSEDYPEYSEYFQCSKEDLCYIRSWANIAAKRFPVSLRFENVASRNSDITEHIDFGLIDNLNHLIDDDNLLIINSQELEDL